MVQAVVTFKSGGTAFILAFFFGLVLFNGIGHMYIGKVRRGFGVMILGWVIYSTMFILLLASSIPFIENFSNLNFNKVINNFNNNNNTATNNNNIASGLPHLPFISLFVFGIVFFAYWLIQALDANRLAKKFNKHLDKTGNVLWY